MAKKSKRTTGFIRYTNYNFVSKDPIIDQSRTLVQSSGKSYAQIQKECGVSASTQYNWFHGKTRRPQFCTIKAVVRACGKDVVIK